jgi:hypothetical protein
MESKQTAVEWFFEHLMPFIEFSDAEKREDVRNVLEQAKEMIKEQIIDAANFDSKSRSENGYAKGEQYYTETYKSKTDAV